MAAKPTWSASSIQSMPGVSSTPNAPATSVPTNAATTPMSRVSQIGMFCLPGTTRRPSAPMTRPMMSAVKKPVISTRGVPSLGCVDASLVAPINHSAKPGNRFRHGTVMTVPDQ